MKHQLFVTTIRSLAFAALCATALLGTAAEMSRSKSPSELPSCARDSLPGDLQSALETSLSSWKIQNVSSLSARANERWQAEKPLKCPGIAVGQFEILGQSSYAILLVPRQNPDSAYKILVFSPNANHPTAALRALDEWDKGGAANNFIHATTIAKVFSAESVRKLKVETKDGILAVESGEDEYGVEVFFGSNGAFRHEPIDD
jgi:hypothetical protein